MKADASVMKRLAQLVILFALLASLEATAFACVCVNDSLGKRYRKAKAVFIGRAIDADAKGPAAALVQGDQQQTIEVIKAWKGIHRRYVSVSFERVTSSGDCPVIYFLESGKQYLVFAYGDELEVKAECSDTWEIPADQKSRMYDPMQRNIRKLDSFWFRFRARLKLS
jgi:hypothetical protein